jgi:hypothetical protein
MNDESYCIPFSHREHGDHQVDVQVRELEDDYMLSCTLPDSSELICFAALQGLRRKVEGRGWAVCCLGSRRNIWPSAMSRSMGGGVKAYVMQMGVSASQLVNIFDPDDDPDFATVADQEAFSRSWFASLG